jgi:hypothetical protein
MPKTLNNKTANGITVVACVIICGVFLLYAFIQRGMAERARQHVKETVKLVEVQEQIARTKAAEAKRMELELKQAKQRIQEKDSIISVLKKTRK